jgi:hypothetical protein
MQFLPTLARSSEQVKAAVEGSYNRVSSRVPRFTTVAKQTFMSTYSIWIFSLITKQTFILEITCILLMNFIVSREILCILLINSIVSTELFSILLMN